MAQHIEEQSNQATPEHRKHSGRKITAAIAAVAFALAGYAVSRGQSGQESPPERRPAGRVNLVDAPETDVPSGYKLGKIGMDYSASMDKLPAVEGDTFEEVTYVTSNNKRIFMDQVGGAWENIVNSDSEEEALKHLDAHISSQNPELRESFLALREARGNVVHIDYWYDENSLTADFSEGRLRTVSVNLGRRENGVKPADSSASATYLLEFSPEEIVNPDTGRLITNWQLTSIELGHN